MIHNFESLSLGFPYFPFVDFARSSFVMQSLSKEKYTTAGLIEFVYRIPPGVNPYLATADFLTNALRVSERSQWHEWFTVAPAISSATAMQRISAHYECWIYLAHSGPGIE